jgi:hypothetical protein
MWIAGLSPAMLEVFGSLVTYTDASILPPGVSPSCQDVQFTLEGVRTRDGLVSILGPLSGGAADGCASVPVATRAAVSESMACLISRAEEA